MNGLRKPTAQIARFAPEVEPAIPGNDPGIIRRNGAVGIDAQNFSQTIAQRLRVRAVSIFTDASVQLAVWSKMDRATIVIGGVAQVVEIDQDELAVGRRDIPVRLNRLMRLCAGEPGTV